MNINVYNPSKEIPFQFQLLLHTYFRCPDIRRVQITGLNGCTFIDKTREPPNSYQVSKKDLKYLYLSKKKISRGQPRVQPRGQPQGTPSNSDCKKFQFSSLDDHESRFLEVLLKLQADGELKKYVIYRISSYQTASYSFRGNYFAKGHST